MLQMKKQIFIVDDDPGILDALQLALTKSNYELSMFENGEALLANMGMKPDLILLDKQLPGIDGLDVCKTLKNQSDTKEIPIIILSASPHFNNAALQAGANEVLEKPFSLKVLRLLVEKYVV